MISAAFVLSLVIGFFVFSLLKGLYRGGATCTLYTVHCTFSIVIACKNEEHNLSKLFDSLRKLIYSGDYEIILIDDNSTDETFELMRQFCSESSQYHAYRLVDPDKKGKKHALQYGIEKSMYEWIALTDADCIVPPDWLEEINKNLIPHTSYLIGYSPEIYKSSFQYFKQVATAINYAASAYAGMPVSCNGRNLVFNKKAFHEVGGLNGLFQYPTGEDKLLMQRFKEHNKIIKYMPYPPVYTFPVEKEELNNQNLRRYGVFSLSKLPWQIGMSLIGILLILAPIELIFKQTYLPTLLLLIILELYMIIGFILHKEKIKAVYFLYATVFPYYLVFQIIRSRTKKWKWK